MPPKRKGSQSSAAKKKQKVSEQHQQEEHANSDTIQNNEPISVNNDPNSDETQFNTLTDFYTDVVNHAMDLKDQETGEVISGPFLKLPPKKLYADYYQLILNPISINEIRTTSVVKKRGIPAKEIVDGNGISLDEFKNMWIQMAENASTYNDPESLIVNDANFILDYVIKRIDNFKPHYEQLHEKDISKTVVTDHKIDNINDNKSNNDINNDDNETKVEEEYKNKDTTVDKSENVDFKLIDVSDYDDSNDDYTPDLLKVFRHLLSFKVSHHKNSIPLSKVLLELPDKKDPSTEDYYEIVTQPMCFNIVGERLDKGEYKQGTIGYKKFADDVNLIFDNALDVYGDGPYYRAATGLSKAFAKRLEKFNVQVIEKRKLAALNPKSKSKAKSSNNKTSSNNSISNFDEDVDGNKSMIEGEEKNENVENDQENEAKEDEESVPPPVEIPTIIRKHDIEKATKVEEIDDITAFIKKFTICSTANLNNFANNLKNMDNNKNLPHNNLSLQNPSIFENIIFEPAGNSTIGGSSYIIQLPGSAIIGHEIACIVHLQNKIVDAKYISELRVNGENINGVPMSITYDEDAGENGMFCAGKYGVRLGFGLNYFEFTVKVPYPLQGKRFPSEIDNSAVSSTDSETEKRERHERGKSQEFVENVKVWLNVTR
jgi:chromatin structure-remodeling complex subunit RSC4